MILEILINSIISGLLLSLVAIGFGIVFHTTKVFHLAHGAFYVYVPYLVWFFSNNTVASSFQLFFLLLALILSLGIVYLIEKWLYFPLYQKGNNQTISLISSLGVYIVLVNTLTFIFGNESISLNHYSKIYFQETNFRVTSAELNQVVISVVVLIAVYILTKGKLYMKIRAVADKPNVAEKFGISISKSRIMALFIGTILVGVSGYLTSIDVAIDAHSGMGVTLAAAVAVIIGGEMSIKGTLFICLIITAIQNFSILIIPSKWEETIVYILLLIVMLFYNKGLIRNKLRVEAI